MVAISGRIEDSGGVGLTGILRVTLDSFLVDTSDNPDTTQVSVPTDFAVENGLLSINLTESQTKSVTYRFEFLQQTSDASYFFADGGLYTGPKHYWSDNNWYTGAAHTVDSVLLFEDIDIKSLTYLDFHAIVPNQPTCEFAALLPTGITTDILDTSLRRLAEILTGDVDYVEALRGGPRFTGEWAIATYYKQDDSVSYGGSSWIWINPDPGVGSVPSTENPDWQLIARKGEYGGTGGQDTPYNEAGWNGALWAPTANVIRDILELLAPKADPVFTGNPTVPLQFLTDEDFSIACTLYVANKISDRLSKATFATQASTDSSTKPATTAFVKNTAFRYSRMTDTKASGINGGSSVAGIQTRTLNTIEVNAGDIVTLASNTFTLRPGTYRIRVEVPGYAVNRHRAILLNVTSGVLVRGRSAIASVAGAAQSDAILTHIFTLAANADFQVRQYCETASGSSALGVQVGEVGISEIYTQVEIWRID